MLERTLERSFRVPKNLNEYPYSSELYDFEPAYLSFDEYGDFFLIFGNLKVFFRIYVLASVYLLLFNCGGGFWNER